MKPTVGVVIPAFNAERFIAEALDSVASQSLPPQQVVVVDDGSGDRTSERIREWERDNELAISLIRQENMGASAARNRGVAALTTDLVALLDADDVWEADHLALLVPEFEIHPELVLVFGDQRIWDGRETIRESFLEGKTALENLPVNSEDSGLQILEEGVFLSLIGGNYIPPSTSVVRLSGFREIDGFDEGIRNCEDRDFMLRLSRVGPFGYRTEIHSSYRLHGDNVSHPDNRLKMQRCGVHTTAKMLVIADELSLSHAEIQALRRSLQRQGAGFLYTASSGGLGTYLRSLSFAFGKGIRRPTANPKHVARALYYSFFKTPWNQSAKVATDDPR